MIEIEVSSFLKGTAFKTTAPDPYCGILKT